MGLKIQRRLTSKSKALTILIAVFALVAQPFYGLVSSQVANATNDIQTEQQVTVAANPILKKIDPYFVQSQYKGIAIDISVEGLTDATAVEVKVDRLIGGPVIKTAKESVLNTLNTGSAAGTTAPIVIQQGTYNEAGSGSWNQPNATWTNKTEPTNVTVTITRSNGETLSAQKNINEFSIGFAALADVMPADLSPVLGNISPANRAIVGGVKQFSVEATDESGLEKIALYLRNLNDTNDNKEYSLKKGAGDVWYFDVDTTALTNNAKYNVALRAVAKDGINKVKYFNNRGGEHVITVDNSGPVISNVRVASLVSKSAEIRVDIDDTSELDLRNGRTHVRFTRGSQMTNGALASSLNTAFVYDEVNDDYVASIDTTAFADNASGTYWIYVRAEDKLGNASSNDDKRGIVVENIAPKIEVKPESVGSVEDKVFRNVSFKLFDSFKIDRVVLNGVTKDLTNNNYGDLNNVKPGIYGAIEGLNTLVLYDVAGNSTTYAFTLDTTPATGTFTYSNNNGSAVTSNDVKVILTTIEDVKTPIGWIQNGNAKTFEKVHNSNGKYTVTAEDLAGNIATLRYEVKRIDRTAPVINGITQDALYNRDVTYTVTEQSIDKIIVDGVTYSEQNAKYIITADGTHSVKVIDKAGNEAEVNFTIDQTAPKASLTISPVDEEGNVTVVGSAVEQNIKSHWFEIKRPNGTLMYEYVSRATSSSHTFTIDTSNMDNGVYAVRYVATDLANNRSDDPNYLNSKVGTFTVNNLNATVLGENFNTVDDNYKGVSVGFSVEDFVDVTGVIVAIMRQDESVVTKTANEGVLDLINNSQGKTQLTAPFVITGGSFTEALDEFYWKPANVVGWNENTRPVSVTVTVIDANGQKVFLLPMQFTEGEPSHPTYASLLTPIDIPTPVDTPEGVDTGTTPGDTPDGEGINTTPQIGSEAGSLPNVPGLSVFTPLTQPLFSTAPFTGAAAVVAQPATEDEADANDDNDAEVLGTQDKAGTPLTNTAAIETGSDGWSIFGLAWYWWLLILTALIGAWLLIAAAIRRSRGETT